MQEALQGGLFEPQQTPAQKAALERLETTLALVEGWVDEVVGQATAERMPAATKLQEAIRRRRAAGGPAEETFAALVGLELRPRRLRDASTLWGSLRSRQGMEARDAVWAHPDLLPDRRRPRRPAGLPRGPARRARDQRRGLRQGPRRAARRRAGRAGDPTRTARTREPARRRRSTSSRHWRAPDAEQEALRAAYVAHLERAPRRAVALLLPRPPDRRRARAQPRPTRTCCSTCTARPGAGSTSAVTSSPRTPRSPALPCARRPRSRACAAWWSRPSRCTSPATRWSSATRAGTVHHLDVRFLARAARTPSRWSARSRSTCAGGRSTTCRPTSPTCVELVALALAAPL